MRTILWIIGLITLTLTTPALADPPNPGPKDIPVPPKPALEQGK